MKYILHYLKAETVSISASQAEVIEIMNTVNSYRFNKDLTARCKRLINQLDLVERKIQKQIADIENCIESIPDSDEREMARLYFVDLLEYEEIGNRFFMDRRTVARRIKKHTDKWTCFDNQSINKNT